MKKCAWVLFIGIFCGGDLVAGEVGQLLRELRGRAEYRSLEEPIDDLCRMARDRRLRSVVAQDHRAIARTLDVFRGRGSFEGLKRVLPQLYGEVEQREEYKPLSDALQAIKRQLTDEYIHLIVAAYHKDLLVADFLISFGADVNAVLKEPHSESLLSVPDHAQGKRGLSPLHAALYGGHAGAVRLLLQAGAQVNAQTNKGLSPLHIASGEGHERLVRLLLEAGAQVDLQDREGLSPLHMASYHGHTREVDLLLEAGAQVDAQNENGVSPLWVASAQGHEEVVVMLLARNPDVNAATIGFRTTALHVASLSGHARVADLLLRSGADRDLRDADGKTALDVAKEKDQEEMVELLQGPEALE